MKEFSKTFVSVVESSLSALLAGMASRQKNGTARKTGRLVMPASLSLTKELPIRLPAANRWIRQLEILYLENRVKNKTLKTTTQKETQNGLPEKNPAPFATKPDEKDKG